MSSDTCTICKNSQDHLLKVSKNGLASRNDFSIKRNEDEIHQHLLTYKTEKIQVFVHEECRKWHNNKRRLTTEIETRGKEVQKINKFV